MAASLHLLCPSPGSAQSFPLSLSSSRACAFGSGDSNEFTRRAKSWPGFVSKGGGLRVRASVSSVPDRGNSRRDFVLLGLGFCGAASSLVFSPDSGAVEVEQDEDVSNALLLDEINSCSFLYPLELPSKKFSFKWVESRKPERYSSAAPLSADARQRIVSERVDMIHNLVISVSIGPPNSLFLKSNDKRTWNAKDVADSVLSDRSSLRVSTGQRMSESSVIDAHCTDVDGEPYWYYEYLIRKSPTRPDQGANYRHYLASTAERDGYLYSLTASTPSKQWNLMGPYLKRTVESFRLIPPTENYVPPYKDPWRFW
ncbi:psbP domain-containing protein 5, chloroplastic isoform X1 [Nymphaea colorata]|nr:psbP domain-containing protein 5, chloroplastic isoform X1 [Nymphaea colorata]